MEISQQIKSLRIKCSLSQRRFGNKIGVSAKTISSYETGRIKPSYSILIRIEKTFSTNLITNNFDNVLVNDKISQLEKTLKDLKRIVDTELSF